jgi:hypothetical protein
MVVFRIIAAAAVLALLVGAGLVADNNWNEGRLFYAAMGRDALVGLCVPPAQQVLERRGFTPLDFAVGQRPSIAFASGTLGRSRVLSAPFTFSDGPDGREIDGHLVCAVRGQAVEVTVDVDATPLRAA